MGCKFVKSKEQQQYTKKFGWGNLGSVKNVVEKNIVDTMKNNRFNDNLTNKYVNDLIIIDNVKEDVEVQGELINAVYRGDLELVKKLLKNEKLDINTKLAKYTPLMYTAVYNRLDIAKELIKHDIDLDVKDNDGDTALNMACLHKNFDVAKELVLNGANINIKNYRGYGISDNVKKMLLSFNKKSGSECQE